MGATQVQALTPRKPASSDDKTVVVELLTRLPVGSTLKPALVLYHGKEEPTRCWEVRHERLAFWVLRDTPEDALRAFIAAVDKRGLRPVLEGNVNGYLQSQPVNEQNSFSQPAII